MSSVEIYVNGDMHKLPNEEVKVEELLVLGGGNAQDYELQQRKGSNGPVEQTFSDPNATLKIHDNDYFTTRYKGPINPA